MILPPCSHQFRVAGSPGYSLPVFRGGAHPVWGLTAIITLQVRHCHRILSHKNLYFISVLRIESFFLSFSAPSSPAPPIAIGSFSSHRSSYDNSCETLLCKLFSGNFSVSESFQLFSDFQDGGGEQQLALRGHHRLLPHPHNPGLELTPCTGQCTCKISIEQIPFAL